ncbi:uncharacterized protein [Sylvia atricapilla]|uniref:uncharacterized protein n=1 Tax=Sylvia atricapilla TaxID=48155 RepID=UPI00339B14FF
MAEGAAARGLLLGRSPGDEARPQQRWLIPVAVAGTEVAAPCPGHLPAVRPRARRRCSGGRCPCPARGWHGRKLNVPPSPKRCGRRVQAQSAASRPLRGRGFSALPSVPGAARSWQAGSQSGCARARCPRAPRRRPVAMRGTMVSGPGLLLLPPRQADSEPQLSCPRRSRQLAGVVSACPGTELGCSGCRAPGAGAAGTGELPGTALVSAVCHQRGGEAVAEADLRKAFSALLMDREQSAVSSQKTYSGCELEKSEFRCIHVVVKGLLHLLERPAAGLTHLPGVQEATCHAQGDKTRECPVREDVERGLCTSDGSVREALHPQGTSATGNGHRGFLGRWFRAHAVVTLVLTVLVSLVLALVVALAVQSAPQLPVTPATPQCVLGCPSGWVGYNGICYYLSRDFGTWDEGEERCSELGASLAIVKDEEATDLLFRLRGNGDFWLGLHWGDGSNFSSQVPVLGDSECVYLNDHKFVSQSCSNERLYVCSKA